MKYLGAFISRITASVEAQFKRSQENLLDANLGRVLLSIPDDCFDRASRVELTTLLVNRLEAVGGEIDASPSQWKLFLAIMTKSMRRANFSEVGHLDPNMPFDRGIILINVTGLHVQHPSAARR